MNFSQLQKKRCASNKSKIEIVGSHDEFLSRIKKTLYYGKLPNTDRLSLPVTELAAELYSEVKRERESLERLQIEEAAQFSRKACVHPSSLVLALVYLERLKSCNPDYLDKSAPFELFVISLMVACKYLNDEDEYNYDWAVFSSMEGKKINQLEKEFLKAMDWNLFVSDELFMTRLEDLESYLALKEGRKRGYYSYTELLFLLEMVDFLSAARSFFTISAVCVTSYIAFVLTVLGSSVAVSQISTALSQLSKLSTDVGTSSDSPILTPDSSNTSVANEIDLNEDEMAAVLRVFESKLNLNADVEKWISHELLVRKAISETCGNSSLDISWGNGLQGLKFGKETDSWVSAASEIVRSYWPSSVLSQLYLSPTIEYATH